MYFDDFSQLDPHRHGIRVSSVRYSLAVAIPWPEDEDGHKLAPVDDEQEDDVDDDDDCSCNLMPTGVDRKFN